VNEILDSARREFKLLDPNGEAAAGHVAKKMRKGLEPKKPVVELIDDEGSLSDEIDVRTISKCLLIFV
jgi:hypothetical protein